MQRLRMPRGTVYPKLGPQHINVNGKVFRKPVDGFFDNGFLDAGLSTFGTFMDLENDKCGHVSEKVGSCQRRANKEQVVNMVCYNVPLELSLFSRLRS